MKKIVCLSSLVAFISIFSAGQRERALVSVFTAQNQESKASSVDDSEVRASVNNSETHRGRGFVAWLNGFFLVEKNKEAVIREKELLKAQWQEWKNENKAYCESSGSVAQVEAVEEAFESQSKNPTGDKIYRKMTALVHPDKYNSPKTEELFLAAKRYQNILAKGAQPLYKISTPLHMIEKSKPTVSCFITYDGDDVSLKASAQWPIMGSLLKLFKNSDGEEKGNELGSLHGLLNVGAFLEAHSTNGFSCGSTLLNKLAISSGESGLMTVEVKPSYDSQEGFYLESRAVVGSEEFGLHAALEGAVSKDACYIGLKKGIGKEIKAQGVLLHVQGNISLPLYPQNEVTNEYGERQYALHTSCSTAFNVSFNGALSSTYKHGVGLQVDGQLEGHYSDEHAAASDVSQAEAFLKSRIYDNTGSSKEGGLGFEVDDKKSSIIFLQNGKVKVLSGKLKPDEKVALDLKERPRI